MPQIDAGAGSSTLAALPAGDSINDVVDSLNVSVATGILLHRLLTAQSVPENAA